MKKSIKIFGVLVLFIFAETCFGQSNKDQAKAKAQEAIKLEDEQGKFDEAIKLFEEAAKLDPENINYPYEIAYAYSGKQEYKKASDVLETLLQHKDVSGRIYQALGNAYDYQGKGDKAMETYKKGLEKFPNAGELYLELGNLKLADKDYNNALPYYEKGIEKDPKFPSNYYWASKIFLGSSEEVWGMIYGEIFMNLERNSKRTAEISKLLFDTYKSEIKFTSDTSFGVSFSRNATLNVSDLKDPKNIKLPFGVGTYEPILSMAIVGERSIDINSLDRIRNNFLDRYFKGDASKTYPNILFDYQLDIKNAGHFEAYNHWLLMKGDEAGFTAWQNDNKIKWDNFIKWYSENKMQVDGKNKFYRSQY
jgi:tetratricopeptide (TPR) repeat protein